MESGDARSGDGAPGSRRAGASQFAPQSTAIYAVLWLFIVAYGWSPLVAGDPLRWLEHPADSAERYTTRNLELAEAIERTRGLGRAVLEEIFGSLADTRQAAIDIQQDLLASLLAGEIAPEDPLASSRIRARLAVLLAEAGDLEAARETAAEVSEPPDFASVLGQAYEYGAVAEGHAYAADTFLLAGLYDWYLDRASLQAAGDSLAAVDITARLEDRGDRWLLRSVSLAAFNFGAVILGAAIAAMYLRRRARGPFASGGGDPPWSFEDGIGVFVRGDFWNRLYFVAIGSVAGIPGLGPGSALAVALQTWATLFASLPLFWLIHRHLLGSGDRGATRTFGLDPRRVGIASIAHVTIAAIAIDLLGAYALGWAAWSLELYSGWTEGFDETLVWGSTAQALTTAADYVVWAPACEEIAFRGVLYLSLRRHLSPLWAALATAVFFSGMHFYTLPGFLMTLWSGMVWALAFERLRSLIPCIAAHAVYNGLYVAGLVLIYR